MSKQINDIAQAMAGFAARYGPVNIMPATVTAINADDTVKVILDSDLELPDVRLKSVIKDGGKVILVPAVDSIVQIARIENTDNFFVVAVEEVSKMICRIGDTEMIIDEKGYLLKRQAESLRKLLDDLLDAILLMQFTTNMGPTVRMINANTFSTIKDRIKNLLKDAE